MECSEVEWSGVKWSGVKWSGVTWSGVKWSGVKWVDVGLSADDGRARIIIKGTKQLANYRGMQGWLVAEHKRD